MRSGREVTKHSWSHVSGVWKDGSSMFVKGGWNWEMYPVYFWLSCQRWQTGFSCHLCPWCTLGPSFTYMKPPTSAYEAKFLNIIYWTIIYRINHYLLIYLRCLTISPWYICELDFLHPKNLQLRNGHHPNIHHLIWTHRIFSSMLRRSDPQIFSEISTLGWIMLNAFVQ